MKSNYRKLGDFIEESDRRNTDESINRLLGVSIEKRFMPSIANTVGTDFSKYKVIHPGEFAYGPVTSRNGDKISIARLQDEEPCIISSSYTSFRVTDESLDSDYLMLWFMRPEFDRYARFKSHGSAREIFDRDQLCSVELPIPPIQEQKRIVSAFRAIDDRIQTLERLNDKLAALVTAIVSTVSRDQCELSPLGDLCSLGSSKRIFAKEYTEAGIPFYRGSEITALSKGAEINDPLYISRERFEEIKSKYSVPGKGDILLTAVGTIGNSYQVEDEEFYFKDGNIIWLRDIEDRMSSYLYSYMQTERFANDLVGITIGSTQSALTIDALSALLIPVPDDAELIQTNNRLKKLNELIFRNRREIRLLRIVKQLLLSELGS